MDERVVFGSHSSADIAHLRALQSHLDGSGTRLWLSEDEIGIGEVYADAIFAAIRACDALVVLLSPASLASEQVQREVSICIDQRKPLIPLKLDDGVLTHPAMTDGWRYWLQTTQAKSWQDARHAALLLASLDAATQEPDAEASALFGGDDLFGEQAPLPAPDYGLSVPTCLEFADREGQSVALAASVTHVRRLLDGSERPDGLTNVLTFYGGTGTGKSALSVRLDAWLRGTLVDGEWGTPPADPCLATVRWDLNGAQGDLDVVPLLLAFRAVLPDVPGGWRMLDLGLLAYLHAVRPRDSLELATESASQAELLTDAFRGLARDTGFAFDPGARVSASAIKELVMRVRGKLTAVALARYPGLPGILDRCLSHVSATDPAPEVAAAVLELAARQIAGITDPRRRPLVVVFVDHFEKLESDDRRPGEATLNRFVAALPDCLFVVTGHNRLRWDDPTRIGLPFCGPRRWPRLVLGFTGPNPRQHRLGMLSEPDAERVFRRRAARAGFRLSDDTVARLVARTGCWPVHIDAICTLASNLAEPGEEVGADELDRPFDDVVRRVLENLSEYQARAFHAACLLPFFDLALAAAVAAACEGDVAGMLTRAMVEPTDDPAVFRVHDAVRVLVRHSSGTVPGGWTEADWRTAAGRGIDEAHRRFTDAVARGDDVATIKAAALAITIAAEQGVWADWLGEDAWKKAPAEALAPLIPESADHPEVAALLDFLHARVRPRGKEPLTTLRTIFRGDSALSKHAGIWRAYRLRAWGFRRAAIDQLQAVVDRNPGWNVPVGQIGITLNQARRFQDALDYAATVGEASAQYIRANQVAILGHQDHELRRPYGPRIAAAQNVRWQMELQAAEAKWLARRGEISREEIGARYRRAVNLGNQGGQRTCLLALGYLVLADERAFADVLADLDAFRDSRGRTSIATVELLALRALLTGDPADARRAWEPVGDRPQRGSGFIPVECFLDALGLPLDPVPTQWVEPYEDVKARWLAVADGIIARAREGADAR